MAAPSGTVWGSIVGSYGRIGLYSYITTTAATSCVVRTEIWFWSKYSVSDSGNTLYYGSSTTSAANPTTSAGSINISTSVASGSGWSTSNQQKLYSFDVTATRGTSDTRRYASAKFVNVDRVGGTMTASTSVVIPKLPTYTVSYNANGGSGAPSAQTKTHGVTLTLSSTKPTRTGYTFQGWGTSASATAKTYDAGGSYTNNAAITLYAVWKAVTYTISYNANGGSGAPASQTKTYGVALTLSSTKPTRTNYNFLGWGTSANATSATWQPGGSYTKNGSTTLYAVWESAYVKPRINNLSITRCTSAGTADDNGTYALISFDWACDKTVLVITATFESESAEAKSYSITASGTSGSVSQVVGAGSLSTENTYSVTIRIIDESDSTYAFGTLAGTKFAIDFMAGGVGAAFGKPAELENVLDIGFQTRHFGGLLPVILDPETDLNNVRTPNTYTGANITNYNYVNCPVTSGTFTLIVESCGEAGQVRQTYINCSKVIPERYVRFYYLSAWGDWLWAGTEEFVLYENSSGSNAAITLKASLENYRYVEIYFTDNNGKSGGYTKVWNPNGKTICLHITEASSTTAIFSRQTTYALNGSSMTPSTTSAGYISFNPSAKTVSNAVTGTNFIKIVRVIGRA